MCGACIRDLFPYNQLEDDDDFSQAILMNLKKEIKISNLIYNPHESNLFDYNNCTEFDPDVNFFRDTHAHITMKTAWMIKWAHLCLVMKSIFPYVIWIYVV